MGFVTGKSGDLNTDRDLSGKTIMGVMSIGQDHHTKAEAQRAATVLHILQSPRPEVLISQSPWVRNIWFPSDHSDGLLDWPEDWSISPPTLHGASPHESVDPPSESDVNLVRHELNCSQQEAVNTMLSTINAHRITIIQGPPGTGKTSVIAAFVSFAIQAGYDGLWLVAQSNVAVKNIAEKLMDIGFLGWKLLVSKDFHFEWFVTILCYPQFSLRISLGMNTSMQRLRAI